MKAAIALFLATVCWMCHAADVWLTEGHHETIASAFKHKTIAVRTEVARLVDTRCAGWRWGSEGECPRLAIVGLAVAVDGEDIFVPRSAFADLGSPRSVTLRTRANSFDVIVEGGDAATSYTATLTFTQTALTRRKVFGNEFRQTAWDETKYSFPK